jgi:16S rRNA (cytosine1402-N4)-methyltransferase
MEYKHVSVLLEEIKSGINLAAGDKVLDCTLGGAGYTLALAQIVGPKGKVFAFDLDPMAIENAEKLIAEHKIGTIQLINDSFHNLAPRLEALGESGGFQAVVMDLGLSSAQLDDKRRGFSFLHDTSLDMSFGGSGETENRTKDIINYKKEKELENIIRNFGEERFAHSIAKAIVKHRREKEITSSGQLIEIIASAVPGSYRNDKRLHYATRTFQALRIATNEELERLEQALPAALSLLRPGGRLAVVSFHSLEDRIVKNFFRNESRDCLCPPELPICSCGHSAQVRLISKKPILASEEEKKKNPRARSAKLRIAEKI